MRLFIGDQRERLALAARACGGGNGTSAGRIGLVALPIPNNPACDAIGQEKIATLRRVHAAAATEPDDRVRCPPLSRPSGIRPHPACRFSRAWPKSVTRNPALVKSRCTRSACPTATMPRIGHQ